MIIERGKLACVVDVRIQIFNNTFLLRVICVSATK